MRHQLKYPTWIWKKYYNIPERVYFFIGERMETIFKKMHIKPGMKLAFVDMDGILETYLSKQSMIEIVSTDADVVMGLVLSLKDVDKCVDELKSKRKKESNIWLVYPKVSKTLKPDINRDILFAYTQEKHKLIANGNIALDETYSMLRLKDIE